jgi:molecular chaperone GrpE
VNDASQPAGNVVRVLEDGYTIHDRLLRPARVSVARQGSTTPPKTDADDVEPRSRSRERST